MIEQIEGSSYSFHHGADVIRQTENPDLPFEFQKHKAQYETLVQKVHKVAQNNMKQSGLREVMVPMKKHVPDHLKNSYAKCNIFMSPEFKSPNKIVNAQKTALVLI